MHVDMIRKINNAKKNAEDMHVLIQEYMPFIKSEVYKSKSYEKYEIDDLISVGMLAFTESVNKYDGEKGNFISFSSKVINLRLIDYYRSQSKFDNELLLENISDDADKRSDESEFNKKSIDEFSKSELDLLRREEIIEFQSVIKNYGIDFSKLKKSTPKKKELRKMSFEIASYILANKDMYERLQTKKTLDLENICSNFDVNRKKVERARSYIIAIVIILSGDYTFIREYVNWG